MQYNILMDTSWVLGLFYLYGTYGYVIVGVPIVIICSFILFKMIRNRKYEQEYYRKKSEEENNSFLDKNN